VHEYAEQDPAIKMAYGQHPARYMHENSKLMLCTGYFAYILWLITALALDINTQHTLTTLLIS